MADFGKVLDDSLVVLTRGRDFRLMFKQTNDIDEITPFEVGASLFFEIYTSPDITIWEFDLDGGIASLKVESADADLIPDRTRWQLVWLPDGESSGGDPVARGRVQVQR